MTDKQAAKILDVIQGENRPEDSDWVVWMIQLIRERVELRCALMSLIVSLEAKDFDRVPSRIAEAREVLG